MNGLEEQVGALGIRPGTVLFVHSSIKAVGRQVRAEALLDLPYLNQNVLVG